jgi:hypothetical protein
MSSKRCAVLLLAVCAAAQGQTPPVLQAEQSDVAP